MCLLALSLCAVVRLFVSSGIMTCFFVVVVVVALVLSHLLYCATHQTYGMSSD